MPISDKDIADMDRAHRDANMGAMKSTGWKRSVHLWFARVFEWVGSEGRQIQEDEKRGKDDKYHDYY